jgi:hypothetical protein
MKSLTFCDITPYCLLNANRRFEEHVASIFRISQTRNQHEAGKKQRCQFQLLFNFVNEISNYYFVLFFIILSGVRLSPLGTSATTGILYQPQMIDDGDCGAIGGMKIGRGNRNIRKKNLPQRHFVHYKSHMTSPGLEPGPPRWEASD